ncbi:MAG: hypothetical protein ACOCTT_01780 [archaeon]
MKIKGKEIKKPEIFRHLVRGRTLGLFLLSFLAFLIGIFVRFYTEPTGLFIFPSGTSILIVTVSIFAAGFLFFGYLTPLLMFVSGHYTQELFMEAGTLTALSPIALIISSFTVAYAGIMLGDALLRDMSGKGNFLGVLKASIILLIIGIGIAGAGHLASPRIGTLEWTMNEYVHQIDLGNLERASYYVEADERRLFNEKAENITQEQREALRQLDINLNILEKESTDTEATIKTEVNIQGMVLDEEISEMKELTYGLTKESGRWRLKNDPVIPMY